MGYVGSFPIPEVIRGINAFTLGLKSVNPDARVELIWVSSWSDPVKEAEATEIVIAKGADVVTHHSESSTVMTTAARNEVYSIGYQTSRVEAAKEFHLVSVVHNWFPIYKDIIQSALDGSWVSKSRWLGLETEATKLVDYGDFVKPESLAKIRSISSSIVTGETVIFSGPLTDQNGDIRVEEGDSIADEELLKMEWLVEGVIGTSADR